MMLAGLGRACQVGFRAGARLSRRTDRSNAGGGGGMSSGADDQRAVGLATALGTACSLSGRTRAERRARTSDLLQTTRALLIRER